ncbi:uncharacterized protein [Dermacentor albipictus]|uniref:uncharacterized protein isoform X1 n=2 Tax=Dermacentor albipictus TaxID=60249 RepID=UPI0031FD451F
MKNFSVQEAYWMLPPTLGIKRRPAFSLGFNDYVHRPHGLFDCFEILGGVTVYMMMSSTPWMASRATRFLYACSLTCSLCGVHMIVSSMLSPTSAFYLPRTFYYILFQGAGAGCYVISCISIMHEVQKMSSLCIIGLSTGGLHALHFTYTFYKMYIEPRGFGLF